MSGTHDVCSNPAELCDTPAGDNQQPLGKVDRLGAAKFPIQLRLA
jgi:hypothetical protein